MRHVIGCSTLALLCLLPFSLARAADVSCECPKLGCDPCSVQTNIKFYSDKCGPEDSKVKSCARPTCTPIEEATKECPVPPAANSGPRAPIVVSGPAEPAKVSGAEVAEVAAVGNVKVISGSVSIVHSDGKKVLVAGNADLAEGDTIDAGKDSGALVNFAGGNKLHVHENTAVEVKEFKDPQIEASRRALLHLIKGKVRNQVEQKYNGKTSYYRIMTNTAVAGVRGTDFVMETSDDAATGTKLETLRGKVMFSGSDEKETREINRGEGAKLVGGTLSPVYKLSDDQLRELDRNSRVDVARNGKNKDAAICAKPKGMFNQCVWKCVNNPSGEAKCRVDKPGVACVRQRCNGNGDWAEETQLPAAAGPVLCPGSGFKVKDCDY